MRAAASLSTAAAGVLGMLGAVIANHAAIAGSAEPERLGVVSFPVSCAPRVQAEFDRGVALLHDFWYEEARPQFERILEKDPGCSMAHWGVAMSIFHQIWDRPSDETQATAWRELEAAAARPAKTPRERQYVDALSGFFRPSAAAYEARIVAYSAAMGKLYAAHPDDVDAGAFYALSVLAAKAPSDAGVDPERAAMRVLVPLWSTHPDHPGLIHYIIHACDNPALAADGLAAARAYGRVAPSGPHAVHMPGHIFSRLGLWPEDIESNVGSVAASRVAEARHENGWMDQFHSDDFLVYAFLQSGEEARARATVAEAQTTMDHYETMPDMAPDHYMVGMYAYYRVKLPIFVALETRDWAAALALAPIAGAPPDTQIQVPWAHAIAAGHLHRAAEARQALAAYEALLADLRKGPLAYEADSTGAKIRRGEILAWCEFAEGRLDAAVASMRDSADLQDRVGQGEVDIPAREMLADMLLDGRRPAEALAEYRASLALSPNRLNGLYGAGMAAEAAGNASAARAYYLAMLQSTHDGAESARPELRHAKSFVSAATLSRD